MSVTPVLIHTDQAYRTQYTASCNEAKSRVQEIVDLYDAMGLDPLTPVEFPLLFTSIKDLLFDKITGGELTIGAVKVNKAKALEILEMPDGYDALVAAIATLKQDATKGIIASNSNEWISFTVERISDVFVLDVSNAVQFSTGKRVLLVKPVKNMQPQIPQ